jgi:hypothetical protein
LERRHEAGRSLEANFIGKGVYPEPRYANISSFLVEFVKSISQFTFIPATLTDLSQEQEQAGLAIQKTLEKQDEILDFKVSLSAAASTITQGKV